MSDATPPNPSEPETRPARSRIGRYEIVESLGKGAMGVVYLAHDTVLERDVALKVMVPQIADDPDLIARFHREAKAVAKMSHPNVVAVFDLGQHTDGSPYIAMELLRGQDLQKAMRAQPPLPLDRKLAIMVQVLAGLAHAHAAGIVHRDIKPANIFLNQEGAAKIMDFGVAHVTTASMTGTGSVVGTADYMSPEQVKGAKVDGRADLFAVGVMLFELLTGKRPFHADSLMAIFYKITHEEPDWDLIPGGGEYDALLPILQKALAKDLEARYQKAYDFAVDLRNYLVGHVTNTTGQHALENLLEPESGTAPSLGLGALSPTLATLDDAAPTGGLQVATQATGRPASGARSAATRPAAPAVSTLRGASPTLVDGGPATSGGAARAATQVQPGARPAAPARTVVRPAARPAPRPAPPSRAPLLAGLALAALAAAGGGWWWLTQRPVPSPTPAPTVAPTPSAAPTPAPEATPTAEASLTPPPTAAPPPTFAEAQGQGAAAVRAAQAAFRSGDYKKAVAQAQDALREDPGNAGAQKLLDQALGGQKALGLVAEADAALAAGDFDKAGALAEQARAAAPWEPGVTALYGRIEAARGRAAQQAQQQAQARLAQLLNEAEAAVAAQKWDEAVKAYDEALKLDPQNVVARSGKTSALAARNAGPARPSGIGFASEKTVATPPRAAAGNLPPGFDAPDAGVKVQKGTQASDLPGRLLFEVSPEAVKSGERFTVRVVFVNEGQAPITLAGMQLTTTINGRKTSGPVPPRAREVGPGQRAVVHELADLWREDYASWSLEVVLSTARGERYSNRFASR